eukprot:jgi/Chlat1/5674/Chrsp37S05471
MAEDGDEDASGDGARAMPSASSGGSEKHRVCMVCDFFYPNVGGVENHIYTLSQCLILLGHKVVVVTHAYGRRAGVRFMTNGLKVYYVSRLPFYNQNSLPTLYGAFPILRYILLREKITLIHGHQAFSTLCHEAIFHARTMGFKVVFTDHSLFGFTDASSIHTNKVLKFTLADVHHAICVSHTSKENTVLRSGIPPHRVSVIPNAVDSTMFVPEPKPRVNNQVTIVVISRLVYRKGADLLVEVIPEVCRRNPNACFIIGGDGPKRIVLEEMREKHGLHDRVEMLGTVPHSEVRNVLVRGHIFLNRQERLCPFQAFTSSSYPAAISLTEAFCIAILEAASCGLFVVSTRVGGVPEVLPSHMIELAAPIASDLVVAIENAIARVDTIQPFELHEQVKDMYSWRDVAVRVQTVYDRIARTPEESLIQRLRKYYSCGSWAGKIFCAVVALNHLFWQLLELLQPADSVDIAPDFPLAEYQKLEETGKQAGSDSTDSSTCNPRKLLQRHIQS